MRILKIIFVAILANSVFSVTSKVNSNNKVHSDVMKSHTFRVVTRVLRADDYIIRFMHKFAAKPLELKETEFCEKYFRNQKKTKQHIKQAGCTETNSSVGI